MSRIGSYLVKRTFYVHSSLVVVPGLSTAPTKFMSGTDVQITRNGQTHDFETKYRLTDYMKQKADVSASELESLVDWKVIEKR